MPKEYLRSTLRLVVPRAGPLRAGHQPRVFSDEVEAAATRRGEKRRPSLLERAVGALEVRVDSTGPKAMVTACRHPQVRIVSRHEDAEYVECLECGEVFDLEELRDMEIEDTAETEDLQDDS